MKGQGQETRILPKGSRKVFKEFKLRLATSIFALLVIIVVTVIELYSTSDFVMPFWIRESEMK